MLGRAIGYIKRQLPKILIAAILSLSGYLLTLIPDQTYEKYGSSIGYKVLLILSILSLLLAILALIYRFTSPEDKTSPPLEPQEDIHALDFEQSTKPTPRQIQEQIFDLPELARDEFVKNFIGIEVTWTGSFSGVRTEAGDLITVCVNCDYGLFYFPVLLGEYPVFRTLKNDSVRLRVNGKIISMENGILLGKSNLDIL